MSSKDKQQHYIRVYAETMTLAQELNTINGTPTCAPFYNQVIELSLFPIICEFICDVDNVVRRYPNHKRSQKTQAEIGREFERVGIYPFSSYSKTRVN